VAKIGIKGGLSAPPLTLTFLLWQGAFKIGANLKVKNTAKIEIIIFLGSFATSVALPAISSRASADIGFLIALCRAERALFCCGRQMSNFCAGLLQVWSESAAASVCYLSRIVVAHAIYQLKAR